jgi:hypothetical protein
MRRIRKGLSMKKLVLLSIVSILFTSIANAQDKSKSATSLRRDVASPTTVTPSSQDGVVPERVTVSVTQTPEMWFYEQERSRWDDPQAAVRRNAEFRASQRAYRIASSRWYGMSNSRPAASPTPICGSYSPTWVSNSLFDPNQWRTGRDTASTFVIVR